jgi:hypothetical protein
MGKKMKKIILITLIGTIFTSYRAEANTWDTGTIIKENFNKGYGIFSNFVQNNFNAISNQNYNTLKNMVQPFIGNDRWIIPISLITLYLGKKIYDYTLILKSKYLESYLATTQSLTAFKTYIDLSLLDQESHTNSPIEIKKGIKKEYKNLTDKKYETGVLGQLIKALTPTELAYIKEHNKEIYDKLIKTMIKNFLKLISDINDGITPTNPNDQSNEENIHLLIDELAQLIGKFFPNKVSLESYREEFKKSNKFKKKITLIKENNHLMNYIKEHKEDIEKTLLKYNAYKNGSSVSDLLIGCYSTLQQLSHMVGDFQNLDTGFVMPPLPLDFSYSPQYFSYSYQELM